MLFNSYIFIFIFLPITFSIYFYLNHKKRLQWGKYFLLFSSLFFYSWWNVAYLPLLLGSIIFNYIIGIILQQQKIHSDLLSKKVVLAFGIFTNLALLGYFKYYNFFIDNFNTFFDTKILVLHIALPLAISFFTFQQIAYIVDSYHNKRDHYNFLNYAIFVTFFPQLIAGPIVHHKEMMPQFLDEKRAQLNLTNITMGIFIFSIGLFKKVIIADSFAVWANLGFDTAPSLNLIEGWITTLSYSFELYFDFSGYTDMAIGLALLFNIKLPINFNSPYKATNIQDFWRRWHITLSRFLKDYLYIPLGGNRTTPIKIYTNILITFTLGGLWHGAGWTFVVWGILHGLALIIYRLWSQYGITLWRWFAWLLTFVFLNVSWVFFRANDWSDAIKVLDAMFSFSLVLPNVVTDKFHFLEPYRAPYDGFLAHINGDIQTILWLFIGFVLVLFFKNSNEQLEHFKCTYKTALLAAIAFSSSILSLNRVSEFLYFNF